MHASIQFFSDDCYTFLSERVESRASAIIAAAELFEAEHGATLASVTLLTPHRDGFHVRDDITPDVVALLSWRAGAMAGGVR